MTKKIKCPDTKWFQKLVNGQVTEQQEQKLRFHLDQCESCRATIDNLNDLSPLMGDTVRRQQTIHAGKRLENQLAKIKSNNPESRPSAKTTGYMDVMPWIEASDEKIGQIDEFELLEFIGRGGMGVVFKCRDSKLQRFVALKLMSPQLLIDPAASDRFLREARSAAQINHLNVVTVHAVNEIRGLPYLVMELVEGQSLEDKILAGKSLSVQKIIQIAIQTLHGLAAAHQQGVLHRDIKPANIILDAKTDQAKIMDFGLACSLEGSKLTRTGFLVGTPDFISPEQANSMPIDQRSDLFSFGCVVYAMCIGRSPFAGPTLMSTLDNVRSLEPMSLSDQNGELPVWLGAIVDRLLQKEPNKRFESAENLLSVFESSSELKRLPKIETRFSPSVRAKLRNKRKNFLRSFLLFGTSLAMLIGMAFWWNYASRKNSEAHSKDDRENVEGMYGSTAQIRQSDSDDDETNNDTDDEVVRSLSKLRQRLRSDEDEIEITIDFKEAVLLKSPLEIEEKAVTIRTVNNDPILIEVETRNCPAIQITDGHLQLENCILNTLVLEEAEEREQFDPMIHCINGSLDLRHCVVYARQLVSAIELDNAHGRISNSVLVANEHAINWMSEHENSLTVSDSILVSHSCIHVECEELTEIELQSNSFFGVYAFSFSDIRAIIDPLKIWAENCLFANSVAFIDKEMGDSDEDDLLEKLRQQVDRLDLVAATCRFPENAISYARDVHQLKFSETELASLLVQENEPNQLIDERIFNEEFFEGLIEGIAEGATDFSDVGIWKFEVGADPEEVGPDNRHQDF